MSTTTTDREYQADDTDGVEDLDALLPHDLEDVEDPEDDPDADDVDEPGEADSTHVGPARAKSSAGANRALIRRVANKASDLAEAPNARLETLAKLLGASTDLADLTFAVMTAPRAAMAPVADLNAIAEADAFSAGIVAAALGRNRLKSVWTLVRDLGAELAETVPASDAKAAMALAPAVHHLPQTVREELAQVVTLARKS